MNKDYFLVDYFIDKGAHDWNRAMAYAADNNYLGMVQISLRDWLKTILVLFAIFIDKGATDFDSAMAYASGNNHFGMVQFFIDKGANIAKRLAKNKTSIVLFANNFNRAIEYATGRNHLRMVQFIIDKGANN